MYPDRLQQQQDKALFSAVLYMHGAAKEVLCICGYCRERSKGPLLTSLEGIGTSGGPAAPLVNMLLLGGPRRHTLGYHVHTNTRVVIYTYERKVHVHMYIYICSNTVSFLG